MKLTPAQKAKEWRRNNPEKVRAYYERTKEKQNAASKEYHKKNKEKIKETFKKYYKRNKERKLKYQNEYNNKNMVKIRENQIRYRNENPERVKEIFDKSHDRRNFNGLRIKTLERDGYTCQKCGMNEEEHFDKWECSLIVHHKDGNGRDKENPNNTLENLKTLCKKCHGKEHGRNKKEKGLL